MNKYILLLAALTAVSAIAACDKDDNGPSVPGAVNAPEYSTDEKPEVRTE